MIIALAVVLCGILFASSTYSHNHRLLTLLILLFVVLLICYIRYHLDNNNKDHFTNSYINNYAPLEYNMSNMNVCPESQSNLQSANVTSTPKFIFPSPAPMAWDGLKLQSTPKPTYPLISDVTIFSPVGDGILLTEDMNAATFNTVDGKRNSPRHLFMLAHNQSHPECCPATFSDSRGCVCMTEDQINLINQRYGNRTSDTYPNI